MIIRENCSLKSYNSFGLDVKARFVAEVDSAEEIIQLLSNAPFRDMPRLVLGGGSNVLFLKDQPGLVIINRMPGITLIPLAGDEVLVKAGAGEVWHNLVEFCIREGLGGIENLSLIPGSVGAAPMQNIGAYGAEIKDVFEELEALDLSEMQLKKFDKAACRFGYRDSFFKHEGKNRYVITRVCLRLRRNAGLNTSYGAIADELRKAGIINPGLRELSDAVCRIRKSKLPDPKITGNAGSFFKNPVVSRKDAEAMKKKHPGLISYPQEDGSEKLAAGWLIEQCGWKGKRAGEAGIHPMQALVLVNYGKASGQDILDLSMQVQKSVREKFGVTLEPEVNLIS